MLKLNIKDFSVIESATVEIGRFTLLIGRQASGKSVISKLGHFLSVKMRAGLFGFDEFDNLVSFKSALKSEFVESFPPALWGDSEFFVSIEFGSLVISISGQNKGGDRPTISIDFSSEFKNIFQFAKRLYRDIQSKGTLKSPERDTFAASWRLKQKVSEKIEERISSICGHSIGYSYFIPAGRAFYTSVGRMLSVVESDIDVFTKDFGRLWAQFYDFSFSPVHRSAEEKKIHPSIFKIFDGEFGKKKDKIFLRSRDGRVIPLHMMSSGQQELFPMWVLLSELRPLNRKGYLNNIFIEEPEAHLFPDAQAAVTEFLASVTHDAFGGCVFVTTHSPYILSTVNLLVMAQSVGRRPDKSLSVSKLVSKDCWLPIEGVRAYCVNDGVVSSIIQDDLIGENYIDSASGDIFDRYQKLLEISGRE